MCLDWPWFVTIISIIPQNEKLVKDGKWESREGKKEQKDRKDLVGEYLGVIIEREREVYGWEYSL